MHVSNYLNEFIVLLTCVSYLIFFLTEIAVFPPPNILSLYLSKDNLCLVFKFVSFKRTISGYIVLRKLDSWKTLLMSLHLCVKCLVFSI